MITDQMISGAIIGAIVILGIVIYIKFGVIVN